MPKPVCNPRCVEVATPDHCHVCLAVWIKSRKVLCIEQVKERFNCSFYSALHCSQFECDPIKGAHTLPEKIAKSALRLDYIEV